MINKIKTIIIQRKHLLNKKSYSNKHELLFPEARAASSLSKEASGVTLDVEVRVSRASSIKAYLKYYI